MGAQCMHSKPRPMIGAHGEDFIMCPECGTMFVRHEDPARTSGNTAAMERMREAVFGRDAVDGCCAPGEWCCFKPYSEIALDYTAALGRERVLEAWIAERVSWVDGHACATGDCPHAKGAECLETLIAFLRELGGDARCASTPTVPAPPLPVPPARGEGERTGANP